MIVEEIVAKLSLKADQWQSGFAKASSQIDSFTRTADKVAVAGVAMTAATVMAGKGLWSLAEAGQESVAAGRATEAIIKSTGGAAKVSAQHVSDLATKLSNKTGIDDELIQSGSNLLLTFKNVRNEAGKGSAIFDRANKAALDLSKAGFGSVDSTAKQLGKALNDPIKGISALSRAGVTFTQGQKDQIKAMTEAGNILGAQKIIMKEVESQVGGVAEATASPLEKIKVQLDNMKEAVGTSLLPAFEQISNTLGPALDSMTPALTQMGSSLGTALVATVQAAVPIVTQLADGISRLATWFANLSPEAQGTIIKIGMLAAVGGPVLAIVGRLASGILGIGKAGATAVGGLTRIVQGMTGFEKIADPTIGQKFGNAIKTGFSSGAGAVKTAFSTITTAVAAPKATLATLASGTSTAFATMSAGIGKGLQAAGAMVTAGISGMGSALSTLGSLIKGHPILALASLLLLLLMPVLDDIVAVMRDALMPVFEQLKPIIQIFGDMMKEIGTALAPVFSELTNVFKELMTAAQPLFQALALVASAAVEPLIAILPELTPMISYLASVIGGAMVVSIGIMLNAWGMLIAALSGSTSIILGNVISPITGAFLSFANTVVQAAAFAFGWVPGIGEKLQGAAAAMDGFQGTATAAIDQIAATAGSKGTAIGTQMMKAGQTAVGSGMKLIGDAGETAGKAAAAGMAKGASSAGSWAKDAFHKAGEESASGIGAGITAATGDITAKGQQAGQAAANAMRSQTGQAQSAGREVGVGIGAGISAGIDSMRGEVMAKAEALARDAANAAKKGAETHSPSRITTWVGVMTARGLVAGLESEAKATLNAARAMGRNFGTVLSGAVAPAVNAGAIANQALAASDWEKALQATSNQTNKKGRATAAAKKAKGQLAALQRAKDWASVVERVNDIMARANKEAVNAAQSAIKDSAVYKKAEDALSYIQQLKDAIMDFGGVSKIDLSPFADALKASQEAAKSAEEWTGKLAAAQTRLNSAKNAKDTAAIARATRDVATAQKQLTAAQTAASAGSGLTGSALIDDMKARVQQGRDFATITEKLRTMGLNKSSMDEILKAGVENGSMIGQALIEQGAGAISEVNALQAQLADVARDVGDTGGLSQFGLTQGQASGVVNSTVNLSNGAIVINVDGATEADKEAVRKAAEAAARAVWDEAAREAAAAGRR